jgi:uncharacterized membrane protein YdbT with pleckstrin-like domain
VGGTVSGMAYPRRLLNDHETVVVDLHPHWWCLVKPIVLLVAAMVASIVVLLQTDARTLPRTSLGWACLGLIVAAACWLVARSLRWVTTNFVITTQRVIDRWGVLTKHSTEIPLERVNTVISSQGIFERLVGVGDLVIESGGDGGHQRFADIRNPNRVKSVLHGLVHERQHASASSAMGNVADQLEKFEGMLRRGSLTQDEFDAQKQRLLEQL